MPARSPHTFLKRCLAVAAAITVFGACAAAQQLPEPLYKPPLGHHGVGHDKLHHWYMTLHDRSGKSCCNLTDCRPTESRQVADRVEVIVDGEWIPVPQDKILDKASPDLGSHVCSPPKPNTYPKGHIFCVVLGSGV